MPRPSGLKRQGYRSLLTWAVGLFLLGGLAGCGFLETGFVPPTPAEVSATDGVYTERVRVTWEPVPEAKGYEVWRTGEEGGDYTYLVSTSHASYDDKGAVPGETYWYKVRACARAGCSAFSPAQRAQVRVPGVPPPPTDLEATEGAYTDRVQVTWAPVDMATSYTLYRATASDGPFTVVAEPGEAVYDDEDVEEGKSYWYAVRACSDEGCSPRTATVSGSTAGAAAMSPPEDVSATDGTEEGMIVVSWAAVEDATSYLVYRAPEEDDTYVLLGSTTDTSYEDSEVEAETTYWYRVRACDGLGCSPLSDAASGSAAELEDDDDNDLPPPPPTG